MMPGPDRVSNLRSHVEFGRKARWGLILPSPRRKPPLINLLALARHFFEVAVSPIFLLSQSPVNLAAGAGYLRHRRHRCHSGGNRNRRTRQ